MEKIEVFHKLYCSVHQAHREAPEIFTDHECNRILTAIMAGKSFSWKVIGITEAALVKLAETDFKLMPGHGITRAHLVPRIDTVRKLLHPELPFAPERFIEFWVSNDSTVMCARGENKYSVPPHLLIVNDQGELFSCKGKLAGWHHKRAERKYLKDLYDGFKSGDITSTTAQVS